MPLPKSDSYTTEYIYALPAGQRAELIDGVIYDMAPPNLIHQRLVSRLTQKIGTYIASNHGECEVFPAPFAVFLNADDKNYVEPDVSVICDPSKLTDKGCNGAPDFIAEIVSPSSRRMDYLLKASKYSSAGVREYWIIDPEKERTTIYRYEEDAAPTIVSFDQTIQIGIYSGLHIIIGDLL